MPLASFLQTGRPAFPGPGGAAPSGGNVVSFQRQQQDQDNWCWAAVSSSIAGLFGATGWSQCEIATAAFAAQAWLCCGTDAQDPARCNQAWYLDRALDITGTFDHWAAGVTNFAVLRSEVAAQRPVCCRIAWSLGGAHFIAIDGWSTSADGTSYVNIQDPYYGFVQKTYADFCTAYRAPGDRWTTSYFVKLPGAPSAAGPSLTYALLKNA